MNEKHWAQRYRYFSKFDSGIKVDFEGWYSLTQEAVAEHVARRIGESGLRVIYDAFAGCGGHAIALARHCDLVVSVDIDPAKIACAAHNARVYGVAHKIQFIVGDSSVVLRSIRDKKFKYGRSPFDCVCLGPPWGGPDYLSSAVYDVESKLRCPLDGREWVQLARSVSSNVVLLVPRTCMAEQLASLALPAEASDAARNAERVEVEDVCLNYKVKMKVAYYGPRFSRHRSKLLL